MTDSKVFKMTSSAALLISAGLGIAYWSELHGVDSTTCAQPALFWAVFSKYYLITSAVILSVILLINSSWKHDYSKVKKSIVWLLFIPNLVGMIMYIIGAFIAFTVRHRCEPLHDLFVGSFVIAILVCLSPCITCALLCLSGGVAAVKSVFAPKDTAAYHLGDTERGHLVGTGY